MNQSSSLTRIPFRVVAPKKMLDLFAMQKSQTYSLTVGDVELVKEMRSRLPRAVQRRVSEGEIVRMAIRLLNEQFDPLKFPSDGS